MQPFFSVVIPLYNKERHIQNTIESVLGQSYDNFEIIVVNDGSTDSSASIVSSLDSTKIKLITIDNQGVSFARNYGVGKSKADYIAFLDADDYWHSEYLETIKKAINLFPKEAIYSCAIQIKTEQNLYSASYKHLPVNELITNINYFEGSIDHSLLHCSSLVIKKSTFLDIGQFDVRLRTGEDTDFWIRLGLKYPIVFTNSILITHRYVHDGLSNSNRKSYRSVDYSKYLKYKNEGKHVAFFINKNIFSSALKYKLLGDQKNYEVLVNQLDTSLLNKKQKLLLSVPRSISKLLISIYNRLSSKKQYY